MFLFLRPRRRDVGRELARAFSNHAAERIATGFLLVQGSRTHDSSRRDAAIAQLVPVYAVATNSIVHENRSVGFAITSGTCNNTTKQLRIAPSIVAASRG